MRLASWQAGADVVITIREEDLRLSLFKRVTSQLFYRVMRWLSDTEIRFAAADFRLMSRRVVEAIKQMPERRRFLRGMVAWVGFKQVPIEYARAGRVHGRGASYKALVRLAVEALTSNAPVRSSIRT